MSFRELRPARAESSTSTSNPSHSTSESTSSDPRRSHHREASDSNTTSSSKRRRVPESVTRNACVNCKKARAKCDGETPCKRCSSRVEVDCVYEVQSKHAKEALVKQIQELKAKDHLSERILHALSKKERVSEILERLGQGETYASIVDWLDSPLMADRENLSPRESQHSTFEVSDHEMGGTSSTPFHWTSVTLDTTVLDHLFQLYFAWSHPVHTLLSEVHFVDSYHRHSAVYCSSVLVNAICALACHLHTVDDADEIDFEILGADFSDAVRDNIDPHDTKITTTQSFAVMFLVDSARANGLRASAYLKIATDNLRAPAYQGLESEVWMGTVRGVRNLNAEWSQMTFKVSPANVFPSQSDRETDEHLDAANWYFYRYFDEQCPAWPGLLATTNHEKSKLIAIIDDVGTMMYDQNAPKVTVQDVLQKYERYLAWHRQLPGSIGDIENRTGQALPHVLSLLILYSSSVVQLLRPLLSINGFPVGLVEEVIWRHTQQGLDLLDEHYRAQFTCRYQPVLQMFALLHLTDVIARFSPTNDASTKDALGAVQFGLEALRESLTTFPVAGHFHEMLRRSANKYDVPLPKNTKAMVYSGGKQRYSMDDMIDACTRPTYIQPASIQDRFIQSFSADWISGGRVLELPSSPKGRLRAPSVEEKVARSLMQIRSLLNTD